MVSKYGEVLIYGEVLEQNLAPITLELLGVGRKLADSLKHKLSAVFIGSGVGDIADKAILFGADRVYFIDNPLFKDYQTESYAKALERLCEQTTPKILLLGQTSMGRDLAPSLAFRLGTGVTLDCIDLSIDENTKLMKQTKPVYGGNALAIYVSERCPQIATVRPKTMLPSTVDNQRKGEVINFSPELSASALRVRVLSKIKDEVMGQRLEDANVVVCGGRGIGGAKGFGLIYELARIVGGAVGSTRPPCDAEWVPSYCQIGLTGKLVSPNLYIGVALSGSSQHQAGMARSKTIIAINKDAEANIFNIAHYGIVGDYEKVLPALIERCKELISDEGPS